MDGFSKEMDFVQTMLLPIEYVEIVVGLLRGMFLNEESSSKKKVPRMKTWE